MILPRAESEVLSRLTPSFRFFVPVLIPVICAFSFSGEVDQLKEQINLVANQTNLNGRSLLDGSQNKGIELVGDAKL